MTDSHCAHCGFAIEQTDIGHVHIDADGRDRGWLCPYPHMTLATRAADVIPEIAPRPQAPLPGSTRGPDVQAPPLPYRQIPPNWVQPQAAARPPREALTAAS